MVAHQITITIPTNRPKKKWLITLPRRYATCVPGAAHAFITLQLIHQGEIYCGSTPSDLYASTILLTAALST